MIDLGKVKVAGTDIVIYFENENLVSERLPFDSIRNNKNSKKNIGDVIRKKDILLTRPIMKRKTYYILS